MSLKEWERDVINRQRNIVFPDTNLNEGRFYRNIASGKAVFNWGQKVALLVITLYDHNVLGFGASHCFNAVSPRPSRQSDGIMGWSLSAGNSSVLDISCGQRTASP